MAAKPIRPKNVKYIVTWRFLWERTVRYDEVHDTTAPRAINTLRRQLEAEYCFDTRELIVISATPA